MPKYQTQTIQHSTTKVGNHLDRGLESLRILNDKKLGNEESLRQGKELQRTQQLQQTPDVTRGTQAHYQPQPTQGLPPVTVNNYHSKSQH